MYNGVVKTFELRVQTRTNSCIEYLAQVWFLT